jgi:hypothetical protein
MTARIDLSQSPKAASSPPWLTRPDGERAAKFYGGVNQDKYYYLGNEAEIFVNNSSPTGTLTSYIHPDIKREGPLVYSASGTAVDILLKDHLGLR